jgi:hypothetical protein
LAADAARAATIAYDSGSGRADTDTIERLHRALRPTRGAAAWIFYLPGDSNEVAFIGVGNVLGVVTSALETRRMVSFNGTLGQLLRASDRSSIRDTLAVLASDGLGTHWSLDTYPGLSQRHPTLVAAVLYRDFDRLRDDVTGRKAAGRQIATVAACWKPWADFGRPGSSGRGGPGSGPVRASGFTVAAAQLRPDAPGMRQNAAIADALPRPVFRRWA